MQAHYFMDVCANTSGISLVDALYIAHAIDATRQHDRRDLLPPKKG
jgi:hypothetical protein